MGESFLVNEDLLQPSCEVSGNHHELLERIVYEIKGTGIGVFFAPLRGGAMIKKSLNESKKFRLYANKKNNNRLFLAE